MGNDLERELPASRINITLDLETNGAQAKKELPLRMLVANNFSSSQRDLQLAERQPIAVSASTLTHVMQKMSPRCAFNVANHLQKNKKFFPGSGPLVAAALSKDNHSANSLDPSFSLRDHLKQENKPEPADTILVAVTFNSMADFKPEAVVRCVPQLRRLIAMRNVLEDLRSRLLNDPQLRKAFESKKKAFVEKLLAKEGGNES